jgi:hypothetical protein
MQASRVASSVAQRVKAVNISPRDADTDADADADGDGDASLMSPSKTQSSVAMRTPPSARYQR